MSQNDLYRLAAWIRHELDDLELVEQRIATGWERARAFALFLEETANVAG